MINIKSSSKGLDENMNAAKHNFLLRGYFRKQAEAAEEKKQDAADKLLKEQKKKAAEDKKAAKEKAKNEKK
jgi:phospholipid/cholesterol/gamma-HCH transport system substrate-binding protein